MKNHHLHTFVIIKYEWCCLRTCYTHCWVALDLNYTAKTCLVVLWCIERDFSNDFCTTLHSKCTKNYTFFIRNWQKVLQITLKSINSHTICMQRCAKIVKNITSNVTQYHQISFCSVVQVQSYPTIWVVLLQTTPFIFNYRKRMKVVIFLVLILF